MRFWKKSQKIVPQKCLNIRQSQKLVPQKCLNMRQSQKLVTQKCLNMRQSQKLVPQKIYFSKFLFFVFHTKSGIFRGKPSSCCEPFSKPLHTFALFAPYPYLAHSQTVAPLGAGHCTAFILCLVHVSDFIKS